jgi:hypothetical protein
VSATQEQPITQVFALLCELAFALGVRSIKDLPGCWTHRIDGQWEVCINGHRHAVACPHCKVTVPPFHAYLQFNGWTAGVISPHSGTLADGALANERTLVEALQQAIAKAKDTTRTLRPAQGDSRSES